MVMRRDPSSWPSLAGLLGPLLFVISLAFLGTVRPGMAAEGSHEARCSESNPDIFTRVSPAVVSIAATSINPYRLSGRVSHIAASGVIIDSSGIVLTNSHVVFRRHAIMVTLDDGTALPAEFVGADPIFDLAIVRIPVPSEGALPTATLGDSDRVRVGEEVLAIGNPLGLDQTLTRGIVSAINRILPETPFSILEPLIQTDTPINPGNSGGPLLNRCGEVIGITTSIVPDAQNIGFAIPVNLAKTVVPSLITQGRVIRPWVGFHGQLVGDGLQALLRVPLVEGLLVEVVEPGSPAEKAGLRGGQLDVAIAGHELLIGGDIITRMNGTRLSAPDRLAEVMRTLKVGTTINLTVFRDGEFLEVKYPLPERPVLPGDGADQLILTPGANRSSQPAGPKGSLSKTR